MHQKMNDQIESLYKTQYSKVFRLAYRMLKNTQAAEELAHDTFCLAVFQQDKFLAHPNPEAWLMNVVKKLTYNEIRRAENRLTVPLEEALTAAAPQDSLKIEDLLPSSLSQQDKQILIWRFDHLLSYQEIAFRLKISEAGCRSRVARAVARCRQLINC